MVRQAIRDGVSWAGIAAGPSAWAGSTQLNYALVPQQCAERWIAVPVVSLVLICLCLLGGGLSWQAWQQGGASAKKDRTFETERFVAMVGILLSALFALTISMQTAASFILDSCIR